MDRQSSDNILRHLRELKEARPMSRNKELLEETIEYWEGEFTVKQHKELIN